jgi:hypothetical protein
MQAFLTLGNSEPERTVEVERARQILGDHPDSVQLSRLN